MTDIGALEPITQHELTPDAVKAYSSEGNAIHYDMDAATQAGFRAPMIGGGMGVHFLIDALARNPKVVPYIDMPIQHISTSVLKRMKAERCEHAGLVASEDA